MGELLLDHQREVGHQLNRAMSEVRVVHLLSILVIGESEGYHSQGKRLVLRLDLAVLKEEAFPIVDHSHWVACHTCCIGREVGVYSTLVAKHA